MASANSVEVTASANSVEVTVRSPTASTTDLRMKIGLNDTVGEIKQRLFREHPDQPRPDEQRLIFAGRVLADDARTADVLLQYDVSRPQTFHLMLPLNLACVDEAQGIARQLMVTLGIEEADLITGAYTDMLKAKAEQAD